MFWTDGWEFCLLYSHSFIVTSILYCYTYSWHNSTIFNSVHRAMSSKGVPNIVLHTFAHKFYCYQNIWALPLRSCLLHLHRFSHTCRGSRFHYIQFTFVLPLPNPCLTAINPGWYHSQLYRDLTITTTLVDILLHSRMSYSSVTEPKPEPTLVVTRLKFSIHLVEPCLHRTLTGNKCNKVTSK